MLDAFYRQLFRADDTPPSSELSAVIAGLVVVVMTLNAGSTLRLPASALSPFLIVFVLGGALGLFWFAAALFTLTSWFGGKSDFPAVLRSVLAGLWPLIFSGVALSAQNASIALGTILSFAVTIGALITLARSLALAQSLSLWQSFMSILAVLLLSVLAIGGLVIWPLMLLVGL